MASIVALRMHGESKAVTRAGVRVNGLGNMIKDLMDRTMAKKVISLAIDK